MGLSDAEVTALAEEGLFVRDGLLGPVAPSVRARLVELEPSLQPAGVGRGQARDPGLRGDRIAWIELGDDPALAPLGAAFDEVAGEVSRVAALGLLRREVQLARYESGARYDRHLDAFAGGPPGPRRRLTLIWYANPGWEPAHGGALRVWLPSGTREVEPVADRLVVFLAERVEHEVLPAVAERWAVTSWYSG